MLFLKIITVTPFNDPNPENNEVIMILKPI